MTPKFSNLVSRILVALVAIPAVLCVSYFGGFFFFFFVAAVSCLALNEFYSMALLKGAAPQRILGMAAAVALNGVFFHGRIRSLFSSIFYDREIAAPLLGTSQIFSTILLFFFVLVLLFELFRNRGSVFANAGYTILGVVYIGAFLGTFIGIRELFGSGFPYRLVQNWVTDARSAPDASMDAAVYAWGGLTIIAIFASIWMCDTAAYFGGLAMGRHKLFVRVSPNKTWEGAVWGFFGAVVTMAAAQKFFLPYLKFHQAVTIGIIIGVFGQIGDLVESLFKRDAGVKDSSTLIPGHGGVFDRFDSLIFVSPILYLYLTIVVLS